MSSAEAARSAAAPGDQQSCGLAFVSSSGSGICQRAAGTRAPRRLAGRHQVLVPCLGPVLAAPPVAHSYTVSSGSASSGAVAARRSASSMGRTVISFLLLNFLIAPLLALLIAFVFGSVLAYAEEWPVWGKDGGFYYVLTNVAAVQPVGSQTITEGKMGIVVDVLVSTVCLVFASTVIGCSGMLAFVSILPDKLRLTTPARGIFALLVFIPAATLAACTVIGAVLAWVEDISFGTCFQFVVQSVCGLGNPLTPWVPQGTSSIIAVATLGVAAQGLVGLIIGVASGITPLVATVQRFDRLIHKGPGSQSPVLPAERQPLDSTDAAVDLDSMPANEVLAYARRLQSGLRAAETFDASRPTPRTPPMPSALSGTPDELGLAGGVAAQPKVESF